MATRCNPLCVLLLCLVVTAAAGCQGEYRETAVGPEKADAARDAVRAFLKEAAGNPDARLNPTLVAEDAEVDLREVTRVGEDRLKVFAVATAGDRTHRCFFLLQPDGGGYKVVGIL